MPERVAGIKGEEEGMIEASEARAHREMIGSDGQHVGTADPTGNGTG